MHTCIGKPSIYPTYFTSCLTTSSLGDSTSQCTSRIRTPVGADRNISLLDYSHPYVDVLKSSPTVLFIC